MQSAAFPCGVRGPHVRTGPARGTSTPYPPEKHAPLPDWSVRQGGMRFTLGAAWRYWPLRRSIAS